VAKRVLIIDDSKTMLMELRHSLRAAGFQDKDIVEAAGGVEGRRLLSECGPFSAVLCDWNMPEVNGLDLLRWMRGEGPDKETPFFLVTGEDEDQQLALLLSAGASGYLCKPVRPRDVGELLFPQD
jgi:two-component system chemotaxis response regulator CheY